MDVVEEKPSVVEKPAVALAARIGSLVAVPILASICYAALYLTGLVYRQIYLERFDVPETLFKSDTSEYFVYAYVAVLETLKNWMTLISNPWVWLSIIGIILLFGIEWILLEKLPKTATAKSLATTLGRNKYVALTAALLGLSASVTTVLLLIPLIILPLIIVPPVVGAFGAHQSLEREFAIYDKGCDHPINPKDYCHVIMDGSRIVAFGFLVAASDTRVAIYENAKAKIIPIKTLTIETLPPKDYLALVAAGKIAGIAIHGTL